MEAQGKNNVMMDPNMKGKRVLILVLIIYSTCDYWPTGGSCENEDSQADGHSTECNDFWENSEDGSHNSYSSDCRTHKEHPDGWEEEISTSRKWTLYLNFEIHTIFSKMVTKFSFRPLWRLQLL